MWGRSCQAAVQGEYCLWSSGWLWASQPTEFVPAPADLVVKRVIVGILLMLCLIPAFSIETGVYGSETQMGVGGLRMLHDMAVADLAAGSTVNEPDFSAAMQVGGVRCQHHVTSWHGSMPISRLAGPQTWPHPTAWQWLPLAASQQPHGCLCCWAQTFNHSMTWSLGTHHVKALLMLDVANVTYVPWPNATRRYLELEVMSWGLGQWGTWRGLDTPDWCGGSSSAAGTIHAASSAMLTTLQAAFFSSWICPNGSITDDSGAGAACGGQQWDSAGVYDIKWHLQVQVRWLLRWPSGNIESALQWR